MISANAKAVRIFNAKREIAITKEESTCLNNINQAIKASMDAETAALNQCIAKTTKIISFKQSK